MAAVAKTPVVVPHVTCELCEVLSLAGKLSGALEERFCSVDEVLRKDFAGFIELKELQAPNSLVYGLTHR